jgi:hypothetical protein
LIEMSDEDVERRAALDPDAGRIPRGFWEKATVHFPGREMAVHAGETQAQIGINR